MTASIAAQQPVLIIIGVDEVGRGSLAGPVVTCAYHFDAEAVPPEGLRDSKMLTAKRREKLAPTLIATGAAYVGSANASEIDAMGIVGANFLAMRRALSGLVPDGALRGGYRVIVDGDTLPDFGDMGFGAVECLIKADDLVPAVSAASVVAKVFRDRHMADTATAFPGYGFETNSGYGSADHMAAIRTLGPCPAHRKSFEPMRSMLNVFESSATANGVAPAEEIAHVKRHRVRLS